MANRLRSQLGITCGILAALGQWGCGDGDVEPAGTGDSFESANPASGASDARGGDSFAALDATGVQGSQNAAEEDGAVTIEEADIIKVEGDTLYALSRYGGLSVLDVSDPDRLRVLGRHKVVATPFEMYVKDGIVLALYQGYGEYVEDEETESTAWVQTSRVVVVDAREPAEMNELSSVEVPGSISDSRIVGDILYVASFEDGYCWDCEQDAPRTVVASLDVSDPEAVAKVDELAFDERTDTWSWKRSISVNENRMYVAGPTWGGSGPVGSTVQVVDISDRSGALVQGAAVEVSGQVNSRWQMDEYQGVLRVISQPPLWDLNQPPTVETFTVVSSEELTPLGEVTLSIPRPEQLQSARFDGPRGYAITFEQTDPLITLDLSEPATPAQAGLLEMPGWVYYMEPRGERLLGLGFDQGNVEGGLTVSLFDVADLSSPTMLSRANFGGDWGWLPEDQDRIQKAFRVLDDAGLILVPFSGWKDDSEAVECRGGWVSGVQLVDWAGDELRARGVAPAIGEARRGLLHAERLLTMSDERVEAFDITDRDQPELTSSAALAQYVDTVVGAGDKVVRVGRSWWTEGTDVDVTTLEQVSTPTTIGKVAVTSPSSCNSWLSGVFANGDRLMLLNDGYAYDSATGKETETHEIVTVDVSEPLSPKEVGRATLESAYDYGSYTYGIASAGQSVVHVGNALVLQQHTLDTTVPDDPTVIESGVRVVDLEDPSDPTVTFVDLPPGLGRTGLLTSGSIVARGRYSETAADASTVRFYIDRVDVSNPSEPVVLEAINVPGSLLAYDAKAGHAVTVDYRSVVEEDVTPQDCYEAYAAPMWNGPDSYNYETTPGTCTAILQTLRLVRLTETRAEIVGSLALGKLEQVGTVAIGDDRVFVELGRATGGWGVAVGGDIAVGGMGCYGCGWYTVNGPPVTVLVLSGLRSGEFATGRVELEGGDWWSYSPMAASGTRAVLSAGYKGKLSVIDASDVNNPSVSAELELGGYAQSLTIIDEVAVVSMGYDGVETLSLE